MAHKIYIEEDKLRVLSEIEGHLTSSTDVLSACQNFAPYPTFAA